MITVNVTSNTKLQPKEMQTSVGTTKMMQENKISQIAIADGM
jgi:hypothetical protein